MANQTDEESVKHLSCCPRRRAAGPLGRRGPRSKRRSPVEKRRGLKDKRHDQKGEQEGVTVKRTWSDGKRRWDKKHYCVFCRRPQVKIARHLLRKHADQQEVAAVSILPTGSKQRHLLLEHLRCRGNYLHNIEVIRQGSGEIIPWRQPSEEVDARNYLPCPLCLGFFLRADLWKHQASCRKKMTSDPSKDLTSDSPSAPASDPSESKNSKPSEPSGDTTGKKQPVTSDPGISADVTSDPGAEPPRKRVRVQAAASRLLPISSGASESCSEVLHRMNQDLVSHQVKSDWLICKYGNRLMGTENGSQRRYDYVSQKLRELGRFLLAAKSLDSTVQSLRDLLAPGHLNLVLAAAKKASGYRWSRPPLAVKTTLKTVCEVAIEESVQDGDWDAAAKATDFYHLLGKEWDHLELLNPDTEDKLEKQSSQSGPVQEQTNQRPEVPSQCRNRPLAIPIPPESRLIIPFSVPVAPRKVRRRPWSSAEKEAVWRQLGVHILMQSVPGKEVCEHCLDLEPVLKGRHWKDIKNQIHNQIQSQKKQQFHAQNDLEENQRQQDQVQNQKKQQYKIHMDLQGKDSNQEKRQFHVQMDHQDRNKKKQQCHIQMNPRDQDISLDSTEDPKKQQCPTQMGQGDHLELHKKQMCHTRLDYQDHLQIHKRQLFQVDGQTNLNADTSLLTGTLYGPDRPHRTTGQPLLDHDPPISPYPPPQRPSGPHMDQLLSRTEWTDESLSQHYSVNRQPDRNPLQDGPQENHPQILTLDMSTSEGRIYL